LGLDVESLAVQLQLGHAVFASFSRTPEFNITPDEARTLAKALKQMAAQYQVNISPKAMAFYQLLGALAAIHGPRVFAVGMRKKREAAAEHAKRHAMPTINPQGSPTPGAFDAPPPPAGSMKYN
jgi:hypothetical protein